MRRQANVVKDVRPQEELSTVKSPPAIEVIWTEISKRLTDPEDLENFSNACPFFRSIVAPQRVEFLFPKVWQILSKKYETDQSPAYGPLRESVEPIHHAARFTRTVQLRGVCTSWLRTIDLQYERDSAFYLKPGNYFKWDPHVESFYYDTLGRFTNFCELSGGPRVEKFLEHFRATHASPEADISLRNPFLGRLLRVNYVGDEAHARTFWDNMSTLLQLWGSHLWYCELNSSTYPEPGTNHYAKTRDVLRLMPNLKCLTIAYPSDEPDDDFEEVDVEVDRQVLEERLQIEAIIQPMPAMAELKQLEVCDLPATIFNALAKQNPQVEVLQVTTTSKSSIDNYELSLFQNITSFSLMVKHKSDLRKFKDAIWPDLQELNLDFTLCDDMIAWTSAVPVIERKWSKSLTAFRLDLPSGSDDPRQELTTMIECALFRLKLPVVERLQFTMGHFATLDFILPMTQSLQELDITVRCNVAKVRRTSAAARVVTNQQVIQFIGYFHRMLQSNIWGMFPKLRSLKLRESYTKAGTRIENEWNLQRTDWQRMMRKKAGKKKRRQSGSSK